MKRDLLMIAIVGLVLLGGTLVVGANPQENQVVEKPLINEEERTVKSMKSEKIRNEVDNISSKIKEEPNTEINTDEPSVEEIDMVRMRKANIETISAANITYIPPANDQESSRDKQAGPAGEKPMTDSEKQPQPSAEKKAVYTSEKQQQTVKNTVAHSKQEAEKKAVKIPEKQPQKSTDKKPAVTPEKPRKQSKWISREEAIAIATKMTPGRVVEVELDDDEYEIEIITSTHEVSYEIDARTGRILEKDVDDLDDD